MKVVLFSLFLSNNLNEAKKMQAVYLLNWNSVVFGPLLHYFHNMLHLISKYRKMCLNIFFCYLRIRGVSQNLNDISQSLSKTIKIHQYTSKHTKILPVLSSCYNHLEKSYCRASFPLPVFRVWIKSLKHVERLRRVIKLAHLVTVVRN